MTQGELIGPPHLRMRGISKRFGATLALDGVDLEVRGGEVLALVGENGAGKSTLMKVLSGAHRPDTGTLEVQGLPFTPANPLEARRHGIAMIYQELSLAPHLTVEENILLGVEPNTLGWIQRSRARRLAQAALQHFPHAGIRPHQRTGDLPVAARQLVEIARALASGCSILVLDEPTSSLARPDVELLFGIIRKLRTRGLAIIYISHFLEEVKEISDRVTVLRDGRSVGGGRTPELSIPAIVALMVGREVQELYPRSPRQTGEALLELCDLAGPTKPTHATLTLHRGEIVGIAGLMGAGRTELLRCLFGLEPIVSGRVRLGIHAGPASPLQRWNQGMGLLSEDRKQEGLALKLSIADNTALASLRRFGRAGFVSRRQLERAAAHWIEKLGIRCRHPHQAVEDLSGGNQQKIALARLLEHNVDVLLLDEPTRGIDVAAKATVYRIIDELAACRLTDAPIPKAILIVSSYLPELLGICDRIAVMHRGRLGQAHPVTDVNEHLLMLEATGQGLPDPSLG